MIVKIIGFLIMGLCLAAVYLFENSSLATGAFRIFHWPAIVLTMIGPFGLVMLSSTYQRIRETIANLFGCSVSEIIKQNEADSQIMRTVAHDYYIYGSRAFTTADRKGLSPFLVRMLDRLAAKVSVVDVKQLLERERETTISGLMRSVGQLSIGVRFTPSVGMLGTILGMTQLLSHLTDPTNIGSHMSLALLTTFYGLFFSLILWTPMQNQLENALVAREQGFDQALYWIELLENRKPSHYMDADESSVGKATGSSLNTMTVSSDQQVMVVGSTPALNVNHANGSAHA